MCHVTGRGVGHGVGGLIQFGQRGAHDDGDRMSAVRPHLPGRYAGLEAEFEAVVAPLRHAAVVGSFFDGAIR